MDAASDDDSDFDDFSSVKKKKQKTANHAYDAVRFSSRGNAVKYYQEDMDLDDEIGSMSDSEEEKKKKREKLVSLDYDQGRWYLN
jgi:hypothetical protein